LLHGRAAAVRRSNVHLNAFFINDIDFPDNAQLDNADDGNFRIWNFRENGKNIFGTLQVLKLKNKNGRKDHYDNNHKILPDVDEVGVKLFKFREHFLFGIKNRTFFII
jgi:hypothetical protein